MRVPKAFSTGFLPRLAGAACLCAASLAPFAWAQTASAPNLDSRVAAAQTKADQLQSEFDGLSARAGNTQVAGLFGESDEEKAARLQYQQHEQAQDSSIATLNQRVDDVEDSLRRLTGQVEQLDHRLSDLGDRMTRMQKDFDYKLCALAAQQLGATSDSGDQSALPCNGAARQTGTATPFGTGASGSQQAAGGEPIHLAPPPGILGTLPRNDASNLPGGAPANQTASLDARPQFESALNMLAKAQYDEARAAFRSFADTYPQDELAPQAVYWVGDIAFVQKDYSDAARAFAEELKKYPDSPRAPESMLKLGQSLIALNQKKEGCRALGTLTSEYPSASKSIGEQALGARRTAGCR